MTEIKERVWRWLRGIAESKTLPKDVVAVNIGMFETEGGYGVYLCGVTEYDKDDSDWACEPEYELPDDYLMLQGPDYATMDWENFLEEMVKALKDILDNRENEGRNIFKGFVSRVKSTFGKSENDRIERFFGNRIVTTGFDDGDLIRIC